MGKSPEEIFARPRDSNAKTEVARASRPRYFSEGGSSTAGFASGAGDGAGVWA
jgi:hypothetical protein